MRIIVRVHEVRAKFDWYGAMQWKVSGGKTWYEMNRWKIEPESMVNRFNGEIDEMIAYKVALEIEGEWIQERKVMKVISLIGPVG